MMSHFIFFYSILIMEALQKANWEVYVPSVKELAKEPMAAIPTRYVQTDRQRQHSAATSLPQQIPHIDMERISSHEFGHTELLKLHNACKEWGFFQLTNHGVSKTLLAEMKLETENFFDLPIQEKRDKFWRGPGDMEGFGQHFVASEEQKLEWADLFFLVTHPSHFRKPHLFQQFPPSFRAALEAYSEELHGLTLKILSLMGRALNMEAEVTSDFFSTGVQTMRMNYYPPCLQPELAVGLRNHSDPGCLTILFQLNDVEGLEIKKDGAWLPVQPLPNAFVVNVGDSLEIVSNGIYRSIEHRAKVNKSGNRISIATFYGSKMEGVLKPAPSLITRETPAAYREIAVMEFIKLFNSRDLQGKSLLDFVRIQNDQYPKDD